MFRFTEPSSGQISKHSTGTFSEWDPILFKGYFDIKDHV